MPQATSDGRTGGKSIRGLWLGPGIPAVMPAPKLAIVATIMGHLLRSEANCSHGSFRPICDFFCHLPPPNPSERPFMTCFSPGVGKGWWACGSLVLPRSAVGSPGLFKSGWTDIDKQCSLGDMLWPKPSPIWLVDSVEEQGSVSANLWFDDAWIGGSSVHIGITGPWQP